ncbi:MAG: hypothetical protein AAGL08_04405 [Cyanobacteria bacterium J06573_11]
MHLLKARANFSTTLKRFPGQNANDVHPDHKFNLKSTDNPLLIKQIATDTEFSNFYKLSLREPIKGFYDWYAFIEHVEILEPPSNWIVAKDPTVIKQRPTDILDDDEKFNFPIKSQPLLANWVQLEGNYYKFELTEPVNGVRNWFAFAAHVEVEGKPLLVPAN